MIRVDLLTEPPVVGETYLVPCVEDQGTHLPLLGPVPVHSDPDHGINAPFDHGHIDLRYLSDQDVRVAALGIALRLGGLPPIMSIPVILARAAAAAPVDELLASLAGNFVTRIGGPVELRPLRCARSVLPRGIPDPPWRAQLEAAYAGQALSPAGLCPHRNAHVLSQPVGADGLRVCPMHGLGFDQAGRQCPVRSRR